MSPPRPAPPRPGPARRPLPRSRHTAEWPGCTNTTAHPGHNIYIADGENIFTKTSPSALFAPFPARVGASASAAGQESGLDQFHPAQDRCPPPSPRAAVCRVNKSLIYLRADFQRRAELRITKYFPHMGPGRLGWRRGSGRPGNLKLSQINLNPNEAWRQRRSKISFRNTFEEIKSSQKNHLPFCLRVVQQWPAGAQRVSDLMIHTNEQFLWLEPLELETLLVFSCLQIPARN